MNHACNEARCEKVVRPQLAPNGKTFNNWISHRSPSWQRLAVENLTRFLSMEDDDNQDLYDDSEVWKEACLHVLTVTDNIELPNGSLFNALIGFIRMDHMDELPNLYNFYLLPSYRKSYRPMYEAWEKINRRYAKITIEYPLSREFAAFLQLPRVNTTHILNLR